MKKSLFFVLLTSISAYLNAQLSNGLIQHFKFNNSYTSESGTSTFSSNSTSFESGFDGQNNGSLHVNNGSTATILGLPYGNAARSVSMWFKNFGPDQGGGYHMLFRYGSPSYSSCFSGSAGLSLIHLMSYDNNVYYATGVDTNVWNHIVFNFANDTVEVFRNNASLGKLGTTGWNTTNNLDFFSLGLGPNNEAWFDGLIDELRIYNRALTPNEVTALYTNTTAVDKMKDKMNIQVYPNPASSHLNLTTTEPAEINIVNAMGKTMFSQKINTGNNSIEISHLTQGLYFIQTTKGSIKFVKE